VAAKEVQGEDDTADPAAETEVAAAALRKVGAGDTNGVPRWGAEPRTSRQARNGNGSYRGPAAQLPTQPNAHCPQASSTL
jgi:hypothetical protein